VYRQAAESAIVRNAHRILAGETPVSSEREAGMRDCFVIAREDAEDLARLLVTVVTERMPANGFDPKRDVQVLTPMHGGPLGTVALNARLGAVLNPEGEQIVRGNRRFRVGDRILQTKNDYELEVFNGDVGRVVAVSPAAMHADFDGRQVAIPADALDTFEPAWCISIHKSQGSEYPAVVVVLHTAHFVMLRRNLIYTALTRARRFACILAAPRALRMAVQRTGVDERNTGLAARLR
jgi:exodeoxyribonuclease V alpha subunit